MLQERYTTQVAQVQELQAKGRALRCVQTFEGPPSQPTMMPKYCLHCCKNTVPSTTTIACLLVRALLEIHSLIDVALLVGALAGVRRL